MEAIELFNELLVNNSLNKVANLLNLHIGTIKRWKTKGDVPENYYNDLNLLLGNKYPIKNNFRAKDQFFTTKKISEFCYKKTQEVLHSLKININDYIFIEPSAGCCNFYELLPKDKRIGIDIDPKGRLFKELIKINYLDYVPDKNKKYIVIGNPPFGLRGNLALRFINHSAEFADVVAFILPPLFNSTGKGVPKKRIKDYTLAYSENLPKDSFEYPNGDLVSVATIFQVWTKVGVENIKNKL